MSERDHRLVLLGGEGRIDLSEIIRVIEAFPGDSVIIIEMFPVGGCWFG